MPEFMWTCFQEEKKTIGLLMSLTPHPLTQSSHIFKLKIGKISNNHIFLVCVLFS